MAQEVIMPRQGQSVESCIILDWKKQEGERVTEGEPIVEVETDKATFEVEATASGTLLKRFFDVDDDVPVLTTIAVIGEEGEDYMSAVSNLPADRVPEGGDAEAPAEASPGDSAGAPRQAARPRQADAPGPTTAETAAADATGASRQSVAPGAAAAETGSVPSRPQEGRRAAVSPRALELARRTGIDPYGLHGTGPEGRVIERDVEARAAAEAPLTPAARAELQATGGETGAERPAAGGSGIGGRIRASDLATGAAAGASRSGLDDYPGPIAEETARGVRKVVADRMYESLQSTAQLTLNGVADARALRRYRDLVKEARTREADGPPNISINDMILFTVSRVLRDYPELNSHMEDYTLRRFSHVHLGFAVDTPKGLMVPTIRNADRRSLGDIARESRRLADACMAGKATQDDLVPGTFTVSNLGNLGVTSFTPVIYAPQVAILGVGAIEPKPVFAEVEEAAETAGAGTLFIPGIHLSLTMDHRAVDGAPAARFLQAVSEALAAFELTLAE